MKSREHKLLFDIRLLQHSSVSTFHGGREHCESVLAAVAAMLPAGSITAFHNPRFGIPQRTQDIIEYYSVELVAAKRPQELAHQVHDRQFTTYFTCQPHPSDVLSEISACNKVCVLLGLRGIEMAVDAMERHYWRSPRDALSSVLRRTMTSCYRNRLIMKWRRFLSQARFNAIIANSTHTKYSLLSIAGDLLDAGLVMQMYPPPQLEEQPASIDWESLGSKPGNYFLIIMGNRWIKNSVRAIQALDQLYTIYPDIQQDSVVLGCHHPGVSPIGVNNSQRFSFHTYVDHGQLETLYAHAFALIYPTLNEGFGYPPLHAMRYGVPVLASAISAVPEVCGDAAHYFNPFSVHEIKVRILELIRSQSLQTSLVQKGSNRYSLMADFQARDLKSLLAVIVK